MTEKQLIERIRTDLAALEAKLAETRRGPGRPPLPKSPKSPDNQVAEFMCLKLRPFVGGSTPLHEVYSEFWHPMSQADRKNWTRLRFGKVLKTLGYEVRPVDGREVVVGLLWPDQAKAAERAKLEAEARLAVPEPPTPLESFIAENCYEVTGSMILFSEFFDRFQLWMESEEIADRDKWSSKVKVGRAMPHKFPYGVYHNNQRFVGNLSWENIKPEPDAVAWTLKNGRLKRRGE